MTTPVLPDGFDITDPDVIQAGIPWEQFAKLRRSAPVWWNAQRPGLGGYDDNGFWVVSKHKDVKEVSIRPEVFSNWENTAVIRFQEGMSRDEIEMQRIMLLNSDPPDHTQLRRILSPWLHAPGHPDAGRNAAFASRADRRRRRPEGLGDFVTEVACELPLQAIAELIGVEQEDRAKIFDWSNQMLGYDDPEYGADPMTAAAELIAYATKLGQQRVTEPKDDIVSKLVHADVDGRGLTTDEFAFFVIMLSVAGNETTRNAITHGMMGFFSQPDQWELYKAERPATTADEIVRWATPVIVFQRTAVEDYVLGGVEIKKGQRVGLLYSSANFDEDAFDHPQRFDITRDPNPHVGFGGGGPHYCLGANLARVEINLMFNAIADQMPDITSTGPARRLRSAWINGIKELPVRYTK